MATTITFDTFENVKRLKAVGFTEDQAAEQTKIISELLDEQLVTKQYLDMRLKELDFSLKSDISRLDGELKVIKWMMGFVLAGIAALVLKSFFV